MFLRAKYKNRSRLNIRLDINVFTKKDGRHDQYDYNFFLDRGLEQKYANYAALEYVCLQQNSYIVNLHSIISETYDIDVENILTQYGRIYYKKKVKLNFNGYVNLKKYHMDHFGKKNHGLEILQIII